MPRKFPRSESDTLQTAIRQLQDVRTFIQQGQRTWAVEELEEVMYLLESLMGQAKRGVHRNPPLILLSNPPMQYRGPRGGHGPLKFLDVISEEAHAILYRHAEDGKPYRHDFERPTHLIAVERNGKHDVLITSADNEPIWQDF
jgi:hypothetical protein